jgi:hypothetical protein
MAGTAIFGRDALGCPIRARKLFMSGMQKKRTFEA